MFMRGGNMKRIYVLLALLVLLAGCMNTSESTRKWNHTESPWDYSKNKQMAQEQSLKNILSKHNLDDNNSILIRKAKVLQNLGKGNYLVQDDELGVIYLSNYYDPNLVDGYTWDHDGATVTENNEVIPNKFKQGILILQKDGIFQYMTTAGSKATVAKYNYLFSALPEQDIECMEDMKAIGYNLPCEGEYKEVNNSSVKTASTPAKEREKLY